MAFRSIVVSVLLIAAVAVGFPAGSRTPRDLACPPPEPAGPDGMPARAWVRDEQGQTCTTVVPAGVWAESQAQVACSPLNRFPAGQDNVGVLYSAAHAVNVSQLLPTGGSSWVGLATENSTSVWQWSWPGSASSYALVDPSAWVGGVVPAPAEGLCALLLSTGKLDSQPCSMYSNASHVACAVDACACNATMCAMGAVQPLLQGYTCVSMDPLHVQMQGATIIRAVDEELAGQLPVESTCDMPFSSPQAAEEWLADMPIVPGDRLRLCGTFEDMYAVPSLRFLPFFDLDAGYEPRRCVGGDSSCQQFSLGWGSSPADQPWQLSRTNRPPDTIVAGREHTCVMLRHPVGAVRCWGRGTPNYPSSDTTVAQSLSASPTAACLTRAIDGRIECWGVLTNRPGSRIPNLSRVAVLRMADSRYCAITKRVQKDTDFGRLRCWTDQDDVELPGGLPRALDVAVGQTGRVCLLAIAARDVWCWSSPDDLKRQDLPPVQQLDFGTYHWCVILIGTAEVRCRDFNDKVVPVPADLPPSRSVKVGSFFFCALSYSGLVTCWGANSVPPPSVPVDLPPVSSLACGQFHVCVVLTSTGEVRCFGDNAYDQSTVPARLGPVASIEDDVPGLAKSYTYGLPVGARSWLNMSWPVLRWVEDGSGGDDLLVTRTVVNASNGEIGVPVPVWQPVYLLDTPQLELWVQGASSPSRQYCSTFSVETAYKWTCGAGGQLIYGVRARGWNGTAMVEQVLKRPGALNLTAAYRIGANTQFVFVSLDSPAVAAGMTQRLAAKSNVTIDTAQLTPVRPGDVVELVGSAFGLHAGLVQAVPWWNKSGVLRSCIHLSWWASPTAYHSPASCVCNGKEDWFGEGELPLSAIRVWEDDRIRFVVPDGDGIREIRLCVEGKGLMDAAPLSAASFFIAYEPPNLVDILPASYSDSTDFDTPISLVLRGFVNKGTNLAESWGRCESGLLGMEWNETTSRWDYTNPLLLEDSMPLFQHCTSMVVIEDDIQDCFVTASTLNTSIYWLFLGVPRPTALRDCHRTLLPDPNSDSKLGGDNIGEASVTEGVARSIALPLPIPARNGVLSVTYSISTWDNGVYMSRITAKSSVTFRRVAPSIRSISPSRLLLGPVGGEDTSPASITIYGLGFRTAEEIQNAANGLTQYGMEPKILIDGVPCDNATIARQPGGLATASCFFPGDVLTGGLHTVTFELLGQNSTIPSATDQTLLQLSSTCAEGYYGMKADAPGPKTCRRCPRGAICREGVGRAPDAEWGFYNVGRPPVKRNTFVSEAAPWPTTYCPEGAADGGRGYACILPCDPPEACEGSNICAPGYESLAPEFRCARCADGYYRNSGVCTTCPVIGVPGLLLLLCVMILFASLSFILASHSIRLCTINTVVEYAQVVSLFSRPNLPWPKDVKRLLNALSILRVNVEITAPECYSSFSVSPEMKLFIVLILPLVVLLTAATLYVGLGLAKRLCMRQYAHGLGEEIGVSHDISAPSRGLDGKEGMWSHGPAICRATLKLLGALYLPVVQTSLEVWNCTPTDPPDGKDYLSIAFEPCGEPGGLQQRMVPWAITGLAMYGFLYPLLLTAFFLTFHNLIQEDQLLRACRLGSDRKTNPLAYTLRRYTAPLYEDYRPGYHYAALLTLARKSMVCFCALMLTKSPVMLAAAVVLVVTISLCLHMSLQPLMTPGAGYAMALAQFEGRVMTGRSNVTLKLHAHLAEIATRTRIPILADLAAGRLPSSDVEAATRPWWALCVDWNYLEAELQLQVVLTGVLSILYTAAQGSVYADRAVPGITSAFFALIIIAVVHVSVTVGYDLVLQLRVAVRDLLELRDARVSPPGMSKREAEVLQALHSGALTPSKAVYLFCCRCFLTRERARAMVVKNQAHQSTRRLVRAASMKMASWVSNPIDSSRGARAELMAGKGKQEAGMEKETAKPALAESHAPPARPGGVQGKTVAGRGTSASSASDIASPHGSDPDPSLLSPRDVRGQNPLLKARAGEGPVAYPPAPIRAVCIPKSEPSEVGFAVGTETCSSPAASGVECGPEESLHKVLTCLDERGGAEWTAMRAAFMELWKSKMA